MTTTNPELKAMNRINGLMTRVNKQLMALPDDDNEIWAHTTRARVATWMRNLASTLPQAEATDAPDTEEDSSDD
jgi:hypothetical protein